MLVNCVVYLNTPLESERKTTKNKISHKDNCVCAFSAQILYCVSFVIPNNLQQFVNAKRGVCSNFSKSDRKYIHCYMSKQCFVVIHCHLRYMDEGPFSDFCVHKVEVLKQGRHIQLNHDLHETELRCRQLFNKNSLI